MLLEQHNQAKQTHTNATTGSTQEIDCYGYNSLIVWHEMTGVTTGGYVTAELRHTPGTAGLSHPAPAGNSDFALNAKTAATAIGYVTIFKGVSRYVGVVLNRTDGTHNVRVQPINL